LKARLHPALSTLAEIEAPIAVVANVSESGQPFDEPALTPVTHADRG
jgi:hypothetical protein